jgi:hypothetical protein
MCVFGFNLEIGYFNWSFRIYRTSTCSVEDRGPVRRLGSPFKIKMKLWIFCYLTQSEWRADEWDLRSEMSEKTMNVDNAYKVFALKDRE